jgi:hypothetical protein
MNKPNQKFAGRLRVIAINGNARKRPSNTVENSMPTNMKLPYQQRYIKSFWYRRASEVASIA